MPSSVEPYQEGHWGLQGVTYRTFLYPRLFNLLASTSDFSTSTFSTTNYLTPDPNVVETNMIEKSGVERLKLFNHELFNPIGDCD